MLANGCGIIENIIIEIKIIKTSGDIFQNKKIPTFAVAFGTGISSSGLRNFNRLAKAGGTTKAIIAPTAASLKTQLQAAISQIIASKLSFTAPAITATLNEDGSLYQAQFDYAQNKEWNGTIKRTKIDKNGKLYPKDKDNWSAVDKLPKSGARKIWSAIPNTDYTTNYNNWTTSNATAIDNLVSLMGFDVQDYHRKSNNSDVFSSAAFKCGILFTFQSSNDCLSSIAFNIAVKISLIG